jgi:hypothetical protein
MPGGGHTYEFIGEQPLVLRVLGTLTIANAFLGLGLPYCVRYLWSGGADRFQACDALAYKGVQYHVPEIICRYATWWITIEFILVTMSAITLFIFRKRVRHISPE